MLQRAASNAYSWWWASHVRTKQSKWLEQNLQDMEEKVQNMIKLIEEDGDSFAKRAEMYYKKRPELIHFVQESFRAYRSLAERYDHISTELQNANNTIASVFPEQVQFAMDDEDEDGTSRFQKRPPDVSKINAPNVPKAPAKDLKGLLTSATKKLKPKKGAKAASANTVAKSGLKKPEALEKIDKLQKEILGMQTEKEFVKSSFDTGIAKYWEIEKLITEMQEQVVNLQEEFGAGMVMEDDEARTLMAQAALKSCQGTLAELEEKQQKSAEEARAEQKRIKDARAKLGSLKDKFLPNQTDNEEAFFKDNSAERGEKVKRESGEEGNATKRRQELELLREKIKEHFEVGSSASLTVTEMAEKIDELVNKVISLDTAVTSQTALIKRLKSETDELQAKIQSLEDEKATQIDGKGNICNKIREMEANLHGLQELNQSVENQNTNLQTHFAEAHCNLDHLSERLDSVKPDDQDVEITGLSKTEKCSVGEVEVTKVQELEITGLTKTENGSLGEAEVTKDREPEITGLSKTANGSLGEVNLPKDFQGQEDESINNDFSEEQQMVKPDSELKVAAPLKEEDGSLVEDRSVKESKEQEETQKHRDSSEKTRDVKAEMGENIKEHDSNTGNQTEKLSDTCQEDPKPQVKVDKQTSPQTGDNLPNVESQEEATGQEDEPNWQELFTNGIEGREKVLLTEYTSVLRNYKDVKKKLNEVQKKSQDGIFETTMQLRELKCSNAMKDEEIRSLRQKINLLQTSFGEYKDLHEFKASDYEQTSKLSDDQNGATMPAIKEDEEDIKVISIDQPQTISAVEEKLRMNIDELLEENLDFWLRFSTSFHEIQKFETSIQDLQAETVKLEEKMKKHEGSSTIKYSLKSDVRPIYKHLSEIETELTVWLEKSVLLKDELQSRFSSLCNIQEEITMALKTSAADDDFTFTSYQAAKFQGEVLNMKQENNKVADELQAGLDHVTTLQLEVEKTLAKLNEEFGLAGSRNSSKSQLTHSESRSRVPLRSFIFGVKPKKQRTSIFSCMSPALHRKQRGLRAEL